MNIQAIPLPNTFETAEDFKNGVLLLIDKPLEWTSFDVVNKIRYLIRKQCGFKKIKVGHAGTLDPLATGLLIICTGKMTKSIASLINDDKTYTGTFTFGATTPSFDLETIPEGQFETKHLSQEVVTKAANSFLGAQEQIPPIFSAKKIDGKRAYESARKGESVELKSNSITIERFDIERIDLPEIDFNIKCSKGTYIRSIANDFGKALDSGAYLSKLRRTQSGKFVINDAMSLETFEEKLKNIIGNT